MTSPDYDQGQIALKPPPKDLRKALEDAKRTNTFEFHDHVIALIVDRLEEMDAAIKRLEK